MNEPASNQDTRRSLGDPVEAAWHAGSPRDRRSLVNAGLVASAVGLGVWLVAAVFGGGRLDGVGMFERSAVAGDAVVLDDMTVLTGEGPIEDVVGVVDNRSERLLLYRLDNRRRLDFVQSVSLRRVFVEARATYGAP
ncbi:MAG: hypothetical protein AAF108_05250 [Planctomycetota bacterium]